MSAAQWCGLPSLCPPDCKPLVLQVAAPAARCALIAWRHVPKTGGTTLRHAFEQLELSAPSWSAIGRGERPETVPGHCGRANMGIGLWEVRGYARSAFLRCAHTAGRSRGWSLEYHIPVDGSRAVLNNVIDLRAHALPPDARAVTVMVVREPVAWYRSQWLATSGNRYRPRRREGPTEFATRLGPDAQWRELTDLAMPHAPASAAEQRVVARVRSARQGGGAADVEALLSLFDVVGTTERLAETLLVTCLRAGLGACPTLPPAANTHDSPAGARALAWAANGSDASARSLSSTDAALHRAAGRRLASDLRQLAADLPGGGGCVREYLALHPRRGVAASPAAPACRPPFSWSPARLPGWPKMENSTLRLCPLVAGGPEPRCSATAHLLARGEQASTQNGVGGALITT